MIFKRGKKKGRRRAGMTPFKAGMLGILVLVLVTYLGFTKFANPFAHQYTVHAMFPSANGLVPGNFVRIAGVNVGKVVSVSSVKSDGATGGAADVALAIDPVGLPLHEDATFKVRPRIFLEGNFFVDISPGTPSSPVVPDGHPFPIQAGSDPVQFDQVLSSLQGDTRHNLQLLLESFGGALKQGGPAYNRSIHYWVPAYEYTSIVNHDALGIQPHDLSSWLNNMGTFSGAVDQNPQALQSLLTDFNRTAAAFASRSGSLQQALNELPNTLNVAIPTFNSLNAAFPPVRAFARALDPGVRNTSHTIDVSLPFITQLRNLVRPAELRGLTADLAVTVPALAQLTVGTIPLMKNGIRPLASCVSNNIIPWSHSYVPDNNFTPANGFPVRQNFQEGVDFLPGLAGESRNFDSNGPYIRVLAGGGTLAYSLSPGLFGTALAPLTSVQPQLPPGGTRPPLHPNVACETQPAITDLTAPAGVPIQSMNTSADQVSGARKFNQDNEAQAIQAMRNLVAKEHLPYRVSSDLPPQGSTK